MQHTAYPQLERASPQHRAASGGGRKGAAMPEPDLETKPSSSLAGDGEKRRAVITQELLGQGGVLEYGSFSHTIVKRCYKSVLLANGTTFLP